MILDRSIILSKSIINYKRSERIARNHLDLSSIWVEYDEGHDQSLEQMQFYQRIKVFSQLNGKGKCE